MDKEAFRNIIIERIDRLRTENGLSFYELAKLSQLSDNTLRSLMKNNNLPNLYTLHLICSGLSITESDFFAFQDETSLSPKEKLLIESIRRLPPQKQKLLTDFLIDML